MDEVIKKYADLLIQKRYAENAIEIYESLEEITTDQINSYILELIESGIRVMSFSIEKEIVGDRSQI